MLLVEVLGHPVEDVLQAVAGLGGHRGLDELALPAGAVRRHDHAAGDAGGHLGAELRATRWRQASMPAAVPALVSTGPSST